MSSGDIYLTREGYEKLVQEVEHLKNVKRRDISKSIAYARSLGDLKENAEYDSAKNAQALNEARIANLEDKLARARIIENENFASDEARVGATVTLKDLDSDAEVIYTLVSEEEANYDEGKISISSPVGRGILGRKLNDKFEINIPSGVLKYKILKISR